jgi:hypothetical protein
VISGSPMSGEGSRVLRAARRESSPCPTRLPIHKPIPSVKTNVAG